MPIRKQYLKSKPVCKVKFRLEAGQAADADAAFLVGDFNQWSPDATPMKALKNGEFTTSVDLEAGRHYQFRYRLTGTGGERWENETEADSYQYSSFAGCDNSVVEV